MTATATTFRARYEAAAERNHSLLCVGLDPDPKLMPPGVTTRDFLLGIIEATADLACCLKPNLGFFEPDLGKGVDLVAELIEAVHARGLPVLLDAKRGDIGSTATGYARAVFDSLGADAVTVNPYLGLDSLEPFLERGDRGVFVLCRTSNPGARDLQDLHVTVGESGDGGEPLYAHVARLAQQWNTRGNIGLVVGATYPDEARAIRAIAPDMPFLMPGVGAQQGEIDVAVQAGIDGSGAGIIVNASRGVLYAPASKPGAWAEASRAAAEALRDAINAARGA